MRSRTHSFSSRFISGVAVLGLALSACGGNDPNSASTTPATQKPTGTVDTTGATTAPTTTGTDAPVEPVKGGSITIGLDAESTGFNPAVDTWADSGHNVARAIFDTLATYAADGSVVPYLAESITANTDATVWTIKVRSGVVFHDGTKLDAAAVQANFQAALDSSVFKSTVKLVQSMQIVDDLTLAITMSAPWGSFPNTLVGGFTGQVGYMASPKMLADPEGGRHPVGTGPFVFSEWTPDDHLTVTRNDNYWQHPAYLDSVTFRPLGDSTVRKGAFDAGDTQVYYTASASEVAGYKAAADKGDMHVTMAPPASPEVVLLNTKKAPLDDIRVRKALALSIDIDRVITFLDGVGVKQAIHGPWADDSFWYVDTKYPTYDLVEAKKLVAEYEAEKGPISFDYSGNQDPFIVTYMQLFQSMWKDAGIDVNIVSKAQGDNIASVFGGSYQVTGWGGIGGDDPDNDYGYLHSGGVNITGFTSPEIDAAMDAGRALSDPAARKAEYAKVQQILTDNMPFLWLYTNQFGVITPTKVHGIDTFVLPDGTPGRPLTSARFFLNNVWVES
ncbi:unannotated protein [freshwater metagenome]|uniref:Unannotated protein n=1 Tax=freshwater metagenome TaxID=449393 RepID=A0A6J7D3A2_9ZZZZ